MTDNNLTEDDEQNDEAIASALQKSILVALAFGVIGGGIWLVSGLLQPPPPEEKSTELTLPEQRKATTLKLPEIPLTDITESCGIDWKHESGMAGEKLLPETMGGGVAIFDYDRDGDQDILFVGGMDWEWTKDRNPNPRSLCLYQNDGQANFEDVTVDAGLAVELYGMSPTIGDFDNDGWDDLYVTAVGRNLLFKNNEGQFEDVTDSAGVAGLEEDWSSGATFFDYDNDGLLDLFVCNYVMWSRELDLSLGFTLVGVGRAYGQPTAFTGTQNMLFHNEGDGVFADVTEAMGIPVINANTGVPVGKGLGVAAVDIDDDGWTDLMVSNDTVQNFLYLNIGGEIFEESGIPMGIAFDRTGSSTGAMGVDCAFIRNDESLAIAIGNFANEQSSLYVADAPTLPFSDQAMASGLGPLSRLNLTFGMCFADLDLDSRQDIVCSNGHLEAEISKVQATQQYAQPPQYFWNAGIESDSEFVELSDEHVGAPALERMVGRGAAVGDLDNDGDLDIVLVASDSKPRVLRNDQ
ncbi:MAG TPA: CRTAC1 family protein, partial [Planctomycetaceae bacterium]|nr:CRTAC1 family protein [Planctomycetaceae bacterium]